MKKILTAAVLSTVILSGVSVSRAQGDATAPGAAQPSWMQYKPFYTGEESNIANPHRTTDEITSWVQRAAADVLSFNKDNGAAKLKDFQKYFKKDGWDLYYSYLHDSKVIDMVNQQNYFVSTIVSAVPEIINSGAVGGSYHWIVRMPITISFYKNDPAGGDPKPGPAGKYYLFVDVMRVAEGGGDDGIKITNWRVLDIPKN